MHAGALWATEIRSGCNRRILRQVRGRAMLASVSTPGHDARPTPESVYSWHSMVAVQDGHGNFLPGEYPLQSVCPECGSPVKRRHPFADWIHDAGLIDGP